MKLEGLCITRALITSILSSWSVHRRWRIDSWFLSGLKMETPTRDCRRDISCENLWIKETLPADNDIWMVTATHNCSEPLLIFILIFHPLPGPVPGPHFCCQMNKRNLIFPWDTWNFRLEEQRSESWLASSKECTTGTRSARAWLCWWTRSPLSCTPPFCWGWCCFFVTLLCFLVK